MRIIVVIEIGVLFFMLLLCSGKIIQRFNFLFKLVIIQMRCNLPVGIRFIRIIMKRHEQSNKKIY